VHEVVSVTLSRGGTTKHKLFSLTNSWELRVAHEQDVSVALSGGGHRATVFGLGALLALTDTGLNRRCTSISSVSGGSIANGIVLVGPDFATVDVATFEAHLQPALRSIASRGVLLKGAPATRSYLRLLIGFAVLGIIGLVVALVAAIAHWLAIAAVVFVVAGTLLAIAVKLLHERSARTEAALDSELLGGRHVTLAQVKAAASSVHHVICTTELQTGEPFYFTNRAVYGYRYGASIGDVTIPLATAVQASACVPGAFVPRSISLTTLGVHPPLNRDGTTAGGIDQIVVNDGGVYDNMADQWEYRFAERASEWTELTTVQPNRARMLFVVNGSGGWNSAKRIGHSGLAQELAGVLRAKDVQYDVSTAHRRQALYSVFRGAESALNDAGLDGLFVQIVDSPYRLPKLLGTAQTGKRDPLNLRADEAFAFLDSQAYSQDWWEKTVHTTSGTGTVLSALGVPVTSALLEHGYVLTMINAYVLDGLGELRPIDRQRFARLCS
jgi:predicted acylesterase/phospholipase RssA